MVYIPYISAGCLTVLLVLIHAQVLQYKKRCGELEQILQEKTSELERHRLNVSAVSWGHPLLFIQYTCVGGEAESVFTQAQDTGPY